MANPQARVGRRSSGNLVQAQITLDARQLGLAQEAADRTVTHHRVQYRCTLSAKGRRVCPARFVHAGLHRALSVRSNRIGL